MITDYYFYNGIPLFSTQNRRFGEFGRMWNLPSHEAVEYIERFAHLPNEGNDYLPDHKGLGEIQLISTLQREVFGELPVQAGWCTGHLKKMNGMEWHKSSEIVIAATDMVLLLGRYSDIEYDRYESNKAVGFYLEKGDVAELFPMVLHFAPLNIGEGFKAGIVLPRGTNLPLDGGIKGMLRAKNKWLLVHPENQKGIAGGGMAGIDGDNIELRRYEKN